MPPRKKRDDTSVKIDSRVYRKAKQVAAWRGVHLAELLSELLEKPVEREHQKMREAMNADDAREQEGRR
jgi:predicted DNA-binding ribbon-helix-helix protein